MSGFDVFYDRAGKRITLEEWGPLHQNMQYKRIAETTIPGAWISTVWLGMDQGFDDRQPPIIFETMVFHRTTTVAGALYDLVVGPPKRGEDLDTRRYATEAEARRGHAVMVRKWRRKLRLQAS